MFRISINNQTFLCSEENTIIQAARSQMVKVPAACCGGGCGFCKGKVKTGQYKMEKYAKSAITQEEVDNGYVLLCKTYPLSDLQFELDA